MNLSLFTVCELQLDFGSDKSTECHFNILKQKQSGCTGGRQSVVNIREIKPSGPLVTPAEQSNYIDPDNTYNKYRPGEYRNNPTLNAEMFYFHIRRFQVD